MPASVLRTLGTFELTVDGAPIARPSTQKARALLAYLAMQRGRRISRDEVVETFWPDADPENARQSLKTALWSIRRALRDAGCEPNEFLVADNTTVAWIAQTDVDAAQFEQRAGAGDTSAADLYTGAFLPGDYDPWAAAERERLINALESSLRARLQSVPDVAAAQRLLTLDPFSDAAYATLIDAELASNRTVAAQTLHHRFVQTMRENGLDVPGAFAKRYAQLNGAATPDRLPSRFIGRAYEIHAFETHLGDDEGRAIVLHGDAGFGKSTLLERFARIALDRSRRSVLLALQPHVHGFGGWEGVYEQHTGRAFSQLLADRGANVARALADEILDAVAPAELFIDDAQRLSGDAAHVTSLIVNAGVPRGVSVTFATRPEGLSAIWQIIGGAPAVDLPLTALTREEIRAAIPAAGADADSLAGALFERTHGHPLFLQRVIEQMRAHGSDAAGVNGDLPASVRTSIEARLRERGDDPYVVATMLAVDPKFTSAQLAQMLEWPEERVLDALDDLLALGVLLESHDAPHMRFSHDVVREVARDSLSAARRRRLHRMAADALKEATEIADLSRAAEHTAASGDALGAAQLHGRAGEASMSVHEYRNAYESVRRARELLVKLRRTPEVEGLDVDMAVAAARALNAAGEPQEADSCGREALVLAEALGEPQRIAEALDVRSRTQMRLANVDQLEAIAQRLRAVGAENGNFVAQAEACYSLMVAARVRLDASKAIEYGRLAVQYSLDAGDPDRALMSLGELMHAQIVLWKFADALELSREGEEYLRRGSASTEANFRYNRAQLWYIVNRFADAQTEIRRAADIARSPRYGVGRNRPDRMHTLGILENLRGLIAVERNDWGQAIEAATQLRDNVAMRNNPAVQLHCADLFVRAYLGRNEPGDTDRAADALARAPHAEVPDDVRVFAATARACVSSRRQDPQAADTVRAAFQQAMRSFDRMPLEADIVLKMLLRAAGEAGDEKLCTEIEAAYRTFFARRRAAAGEAWGGG